jgi:hypothetical protein
MIEGQEGVTWEEWLALAEACEEHGLEGLFRSDHYASVFGEYARAARWTPGRRSPRSPPAPNGYASAPWSRRRRSGTPPSSPAS